MSANENDFYFYKLVRGFLCNYLPVQRRCSNATIKNYKDSINQYRIYLLTCKKIPFNKVGFSCFSRSEIYDFCVWLRDAQHKSVNTVNLRLAAIKSFLSYCSYEDPSLTEVYLQVKSIKRFKGEINPKLEYLTSKQLEALFACPDISTTVGRRNRYFMIHAYETGGRVDELVNMQVGDIIRNGKNIQICLHGKGNKTRYIPLACDVVPHLNAYLAEFHSDPQNEDYLFYTILLSPAPFPLMRGL
jgi:site-specific recombinase XerD